MCRSFYNASQGPSWEVVLGKAGHFQFLDNQSMLQRTICAVGPVQDVSVRGIAQVEPAALLALVFRRQIADVGEGPKYTAGLICTPYIAVLMRVLCAGRPYDNCGQELMQM